MRRWVCSAAAGPHRRSDANVRRTHPTSGIGEVAGERSRDTPRPRACRVGSTPARTRRRRPARPPGRSRTRRRPSSRRTGAASSRARSARARSPPRRRRRRRTDPVGETAGPAHDRSNVVSCRGGPTRALEPEFAVDAPRTPRPLRRRASRSIRRRARAPAAGRATSSASVPVPRRRRPIVTADRSPSAARTRPSTVRGEPWLGQLTPRQDEFDRDGLDRPPTGADRARSTRPRTTTATVAPRNSLDPGRRASAHCPPHREGGPTMKIHTAAATRRPSRRPLGGTRTVA